MHYAVLWGSAVILGLSGCAASKNDQDVVKQQFGERCEDARKELDNAVKDGQLADLRVLKRDIELYCVWRRN
ncbi:MAG: hypothetical protein CL579_06510 [Alteromonadaceae bacterium]|jgi:hypothetical protein|uniref:Uncharacterized protein n=1 Tax=Paraglaciecola mesophila KMM 241 TaxID=1128912 RepID=K6ZLZ1_9ALTE|nr:hypothetical protein [Paraglaciecola mesophila]MAD15716.1 hypothetical protein [Alteromonadaceae bacterium]MBB19212.1 hypothetical protein [Rickettsiales bacterium]GAC24375.1 hypothetical protein GMES_2079 [Paraglaciecola mesophila KMM 241]